MCYSLASYNISTATKYYVRARVNYGNNYTGSSIWDRSATITKVDTAFIIGISTWDADIGNFTIDYYSFFNGSIYDYEGKQYNSLANMFYSNTVNVNGSVDGTGSTGGNVTFDGAYVVRTFYTNGTFNTTQNLNNVSVLVVAGGGGGGAGGGGAGGLIYMNSNYTITAGNHNVVVGTGGRGGNGTQGSYYGQNGTNSSFSTLIAMGGGVGGSANYNGSLGGSGGGAGQQSPGTKIGGTGIVGQGYGGGNSSGGGSPYCSGGGGGAGGIGTTALTAVGGAGGIGINISINGSIVCYAGGGGGGCHLAGTAGTAICGGANGITNAGTEINATPNTGGGGGGNRDGDGAGKGGYGGSGVVIIRYINPVNYTYFIPNLTASDNNALVRVSANNGTNYTSWLTTTNNSQIISFPVAGNILQFQINLSNGNATYTPIVYGFGLTNYTYPNILTINGFTRNLTVELGSLLNVNYSGYSCVDFNHPSYGVNYSCTSTAANFTIDVNWFRKNTFNDSTTAKNLSYAAASNLSFGIQAHQYDEVINMSFNLTGFVNTTLPSGVKVYFNGTLINDVGQIYSSTAQALTTFNDSTSSKNVSIGASSTVVAGYLKIPKTATVTSAIMNVSGINTIANDLGLPSAPYVVIEGAISALNPTDFQINGCGLTNFTNSFDGEVKYILYDTDSGHNYEVKRATIMMTLFYGTSGSDPRATQTYMPGVTSMKVFDQRDVDKKVTLTFKVTPAAVVIAIKPLFAIV